MKMSTALAIVLLTGSLSAQSVSTTFTPNPATWDGLFATESVRKVPANRLFSQSGYWNFMIDSELITSEWLAQHHYNSDGRSFGFNMAIADFFYSGARRRVALRSVFAREVDDPPEFGCGRAPGVYPNLPDLTRLNDDDHVVCIFGSQQWTHNGFSNYTNAIYLYERDGFEFRTSIDAAKSTPRMHINHEAVRTLVPLKAEASGGNVPHGLYDVVVIDTQRDLEVIAECRAGDRVLAVYPSCDNGAARNWRPRGTGGGEVTCSEPGFNRITLLCAAY
jgi:hypothetical protein